MIKGLGKGLCVVLIAVMLLAPTTGCGTFFHWERVGQPSSKQGSADVGMIIINILNNLGLGIIVDAMTGALWVPK